MDLGSTCQARLGTKCAQPSSNRVTRCLMVTSYLCPVSSIWKIIFSIVYRCTRPQHINTLTIFARLEYLVSSRPLTGSLSLALSISPSLHLLYRFLVSLARSGRGLPSTEMLRKEDKLRIMKVSLPFSFYFKFPSQSPNSFEASCPVGAVRKNHPAPISWFVETSKTQTRLLHK